MAHLANSSNIPMVVAGAGYGRGWVQSSAWFDNLTGKRIENDVVKRVRTISDAVHDDLTASGYWLSFEAGGLYDAAAVTIADQLDHSLHHVERSLGFSLAAGVERRLFDSMIVSSIGYVGALDRVSLAAVGFERADSGLSLCSVHAAHLHKALSWIDRVDGVDSAAADRVPDRTAESVGASEESRGVAVESPDALMITTGYGQLVQQVLAVHPRVKVCLGTRVMKVAYDAASKRVLVVVREEGEEKLLSCDYCVCTLPLGVLKAGSVSFETPLSEAKRLSISRIGVGVENKLIMCFPFKFWCESSGFFALTDPRFRFVDYHMFGAPGVLVAMLAPPYSEEYGSSEACLATVLEVLRFVFGAQVPAPLSYVVTSWHSEVFSLGSYSFLQAGSSQHDIAELQRPEWDGHLLFAGEATSLLNQQCVHGAANSGIRVANQIRAANELALCPMPFPLPASSEHDLCGTCHRAWDTEEPLIQCEKCQWWYHQQCQNLSIADKPHGWLCTKCAVPRRRGRPVKKAIPLRRKRRAASANGDDTHDAQASKSEMAVDTTDALDAADAVSPTTADTAVVTAAAAAAVDTTVTPAITSNGVAHSPVKPESTDDVASVAERSKRFFDDDSLGLAVYSSIMQNAPLVDRLFDVLPSITAEFGESVRAGRSMLRHSVLEFENSQVQAQLSKLSQPPSRLPSRPPSPPPSPPPPPPPPTGKRPNAPVAAKRDRKRPSKQQPLPMLPSISSFDNVALLPIDDGLATLVPPPLMLPSKSDEEAESGIVDIVTASSPLPASPTGRPQERRSAIRSRMLTAAQSQSKPPVRVLVPTVVEGRPLVCETDVIDFLTVEVVNWGTPGGKIAFQGNKPLIEGYEVRTRIDESVYGVTTAVDRHGMVGFRITSGEVKWPWVATLAAAWSMVVGSSVLQSIVPIEATLGYNIGLLRQILQRIHKPTLDRSAELTASFAKFLRLPKMRVLCSICKLEVTKEFTMTVCFKCHRVLHYTCVSQFDANNNPVCKACTVIDSVPCMKCGDSGSDARFLLCEHMTDVGRNKYCPVGAHIECLDPPLVEEPETWYCPLHYPMHA